MTTRFPAGAWAAGLVACAFFTAACSSDGGTGQGAGGAGGVLGASGAAGTPGGGAAGAALGAGGTPMGGATGMSGATGAGGLMTFPPGQLMCAGKLCRGGGHCAADGACPAYLGGCFSSADNFNSCDMYCMAQGASCVAKGCNADGTALMGGYTWVSYTAASRAECDKGSFPDTNSFDQCASPIWLSPTKPPDDVIRCCCKQ